MTVTEMLGNMLSGTRKSRSNGCLEPVSPNPRAFGVHQEGRFAASAQPQKYLQENATPNRTSESASVKRALSAKRTQFQSAQNETPSKVPRTADNFQSEPISSIGPVVLSLKGNGESSQLSAVRGTPKNTPKGFQNATTNLTVNRSPFFYTDGNHTQVKDQEYAELNICEKRLQFEVMAYFASKPVDLQKVTVGQVRQELEQQMGLSKGALGTKKHVRRRVNALLQEEVCRKMRLSRSSTIVVNSLAKCDVVPFEVRQMLINCLPQVANRASSIDQPAMSGDLVLHAYQVRMLGVVQDALHEEWGRVSDAGDATRQQFEKLEREALACKQAHAQAAEAHALVSANYKSLEQELKEVENDIAAAEIKLDHATKAELTVASDTEKMLARREAANYLNSNDLAMLIDGSWKGLEERDAAMRRFGNFCEAESVIESLKDAATVALRKTPSDRTFFDKLTVTSTTEFIISHIAKMSSKILIGLDVVAEKDKSDSLETLEELAKMKSSLVVESSAANAASVITLARAEETERLLSSKLSELAQARPELEKSNQRSEELDEALDLLEDWITNARVPGTTDCEARVASSFHGADLQSQTICNTMQKSSCHQPMLQAEAYSHPERTSPARRVNLNEAEFTYALTPRTLNC